jgi:hypothetical protein
MTINPDGLVYQGKEIIAKLAVARGMALCIRCPLLTQSGHRRVDFAVLHKTAALKKRCGRLLS